VRHSTIGTRAGSDVWRAGLPGVHRVASEAYLLFGKVPASYLFLIGLVRPPARPAPLMEDARGAEMLIE
jgi:hypothetical protein